MNLYPTGNPARQRGMATLGVSLIILFLVTLVTLYAANTSVTEQRVSANQYRSDQAFSAANSALDFATAYVKDDGPDQNDDGTADSGTVTIDYADGGTRDATWAINSVTAPVTVTATGFSDDATARRTLIQQVDGADPSGGGPNNPLIARGGVNISTGSMNIVNKFTNTTVWAGGTTAIGTSSSSASTWLADPGDPPNLDYANASELADLLGTGNGDNPINNNAIQASGKESGQSVDVLDDDPTLANLLPSTGTLLPRPSGPAPTDKSGYFWYNFFNESPYWFMDRAQEVGQFKASGFNTDEIRATTGAKGIIWINGDLTINNSNDIIGSAEDPVLLIVNGDFNATGGEIWGQVYVVGDWNSGGNLTIFGAMILEGNVTGNGGGYLVYFPDVLGGLDAGARGTHGVVLGTWRDW